MNKDILINEITRLKEEGFTFSQIAEKLGISKTAAHRLFSSDKEKEIDIDDLEEQIPVFQKTTEAPVKKVKKEVEMQNTNTKLIYHLKRMELEHEKQMKEMEFEELERQREFQKEQLDYNQKISKLKEEMEQMKRSQTFQNLKLEVPKTEIPDEIETESEIETNDEIEKESQIIVPKKLQSMFSTFAENIFRFQNEKIEEETAKELLEQNITLLKYFGKWIKAKEIEPNEVPQRLVLKKIQKILQSMTEDFEKRGFFSSSYAEFEMPEDLFDEISVLL